MVDNNNRDARYARLSGGWGEEKSKLIVLKPIGSKGQGPKPIRPAPSDPDAAMAANSIKLDPESILMTLLATVDKKQLVEALKKVATARGVEAELAEALQNK